MTKETILSEIEEIKESNRLNNQRIAELEAELKKLEESEPWKPKKGECYFYINERGWSTNSFRWDKDGFDHEMYNVGNCFPTEERAEQVAKKIRMLLKLERYHDMFCPDYVLDWENIACKYFVYYDTAYNKWYWDWKVELKNSTDVYFDSKETAQKVCDLLNREEDENES